MFLTGQNIHTSCPIAMFIMQASTPLSFLGIGSLTDHGFYFWTELKPSDFEITLDGLTVHSALMSPCIHRSNPHYCIVVLIYVVFSHLESLRKTVTHFKEWLSLEKMYLVRALLWLSLYYLVWCRVYENTLLMYCDICLKMSIDKM